ncbi:MAG: hypothetical protein ACJ8AT_26920 [Hyalangium sp.]|uniref:hypothetical protein n=1 Tax=Hyalangium sp. TaxID=2028555 RepID=UPI003899D13C
MRATVVLLCLASAVATAQPSQAPAAPPEQLLTPPPMTAAPREEPPPSQAPSRPEDEFITPTFHSAPAAEPPPPPRAASTPPSPPPPPRAAPAPSPPEWTPPPRATGPAESPAERALRYSRYSAGAGGPTLVLTEGLAGLVTGAMLGSAFDIARDVRSSDGYTGAIVGGLALGTVATLYQYFVPVGRREGMLAAGAATAGLMASLTLANSRNLNDKDRAMLAFASTQVSILSVLVLTSGGGDVSAGDAGLVGSMSLYGFVFAGLIEYIHAKQTQQRYDYVPVLMAPAAGMALGGLLAIPLELSSSSAFELTLYPLGAGLTALLLGARLADEVVVAKTVLGTVAGTYFLIAVANALTHDPNEPQERSASTVQAVPVPVVLAAGRHNTGLAVGPGLSIQF